MTDHDTRSRLAVGVVLATLLHFVAVPGIAVLLMRDAQASVTRRASQADEQANKPADKLRDERRQRERDERERRTEQDDDRADEQEPERDKVQLGRDDAPLQTSMAWIAYEDYQKMQAPQSTVLQPATQTVVDPTLTTAMPDDPTPPAPVAVQPQEVTMAQPGGATAQPSAEVDQRSPSESLVKSPGPAAQQERVDTASDEGSASRNEAAATATMILENVPPAEQDAADARLSAMGTPSQQDAVKPIDVPTDADAPGAAPRAEGSDLAMVNRDHATGPDVIADESMAQPAAQADEPDPSGVPTQREPAESPVDEEGKPIARLAVATPAPDPAGVPATNRETSPAESASASDAAQKDAGSARDVRPAPVDRDRATTPPSAKPDEAKPTAAPRTQSESPAASPDGVIDVRPGQVLTAAGIEVRTATPQFSLITRLTSLPTNPLVRVTFNREGEVIEAKFIKSTGYESVDSPILSSLYKWKATGKKLEERGKGFSIVVRLKLTED